MRINSINSTTPKFKGIREDRNTTSQLKGNNKYSLTEPNQRRISQAIENLAKQRGEENIRFLLNVGENLTYISPTTPTFTFGFLSNGIVEKADYIAKCQNHRHVSSF